MSTLQQLVSTRREPPGRWTYRLTLADGSSRDLGPAKDLDDLVRMAGELAIETGGPVPTQAEIEDQICERNQGHGCRTRPGTDRPSRPPQVLPAPDRYGPFVWQWLHLLGLRFNPALFVASVEHTRILLNDPDVGCEICAPHFAEFDRLYPHSNVRTADECAVWTWMAHNHATQHKVAAGDGGRPLTFLSAASIYGWRPLLDHEVNQIKDNLKAS
jgi:hypothetical protein